MTGIILLAAGASTRLGRAKQSLQYKEKSLLQHAVEVAVEAEIEAVIVVTGANEKEILPQIENEPILIVHNPGWKDGVASSIHTGLTALLKHDEDTEAVIVMVCDQPFVNATLLKSLLEAQRTSGKPIIACSYKDTLGVPALFRKDLFPELLALQGEEGGKKILLRYPDSIATVPFPSGDIDIDTQADYEQLTSNPFNSPSLP